MTHFTDPSFAYTMHRCKHMTWRRRVRPLLRDALWMALVALIIFGFLCLLTFL